MTHNPSNTSAILTQEPQAQAILDFWFGHHDNQAASPDYTKRWFAGGPEIDAAIKAQFADLIEPAASGELDHWRSALFGQLALIITLDQFPRNVYRGTAQAFAYDAHALALSQAALDDPALDQLNMQHQIFTLMPHMHAEDFAAQTKCVEFIDQRLQAFSSDHPTHEYLQYTLQFAKDHRDLIQRFGRFPYRNAVLKRTNTDEEAAYLADNQQTYGQ